ncbi:hypothetical protein B0H16DRAFT_1018535 [Mycena metata]|uniref:Novel STAND NTPase 1 domain-containing protein n=1 Tax=Mycena metata TaxID=1033252 RepID=A0AAD7IGU4_9AGAR|nr:hypothetical protein B0H16DRAFT_1018535 [Mycena metata]
MEQTHELLNAIIGIYINSDTAAELAPGILNQIAKFTQTLHKVHTFVEAQQGRNKFKIFFRQGELGALLKDCKADLQQGLDYFQSATNIKTMTNVAAMQEYVLVRHQEILNMIEALSNSDSASSITNSQVYSGSYASSNSLLLLPAEPKIFHGRDTELAAILNLVAQGTPRIAILGAGGMGKTSLSKAVLHHSDITTKYLDNRFFIACDGSTSKVELAGVIGAHLGLKPAKDLTQGVLHHLSSAPPSLMILDNFETLWDPAKSRKDIEDFLSLLTEVTNLALIITMRGAERPSKVQWTRPFLLPLQPLAQEATRKIFFDIADDDGNLTEEVDQVLKLTDNIPLVITLLAHLVATEGCSGILSRWETEKTALLSDGYDKKSNLELSISLSLSSPRITSMPHSQDLLSLLSILPDGLSEVELKQTSFPVKDILGCKTALLRTALAYLDNHKRLKVLLPISEYMQKLHPPTNQMIRPLFKHFQELLEFYREHVGTQSGALSLSQIASNYSNIGNIIQNSLHLDHPDLVNSIYCACHLHRFSDTNGRGRMPFDLIHHILAQLDNPRLEFYVITEEFKSWTFATSHPKEQILRAEELINHFEDPGLKCHFYSTLAQFYFNHDHNIPMSIKYAQSALSLAQSIGSIPQQCNLLIYFSFAKWSRGDYIAARFDAQKAQGLARGSGNLYAEAIGARLEAQSWMPSGNYKKCIALLNRAKILLDLSGLSGTYEDYATQRTMGDVHRLKSEYVEASNIHHRTSGTNLTPYQQGASLISIAEIEISTGYPETEIQRKIDTSQTLFRLNGLVKHATGCEYVQAKLNLRNGDMSNSLFRSVLRAMWGTDSQLVSQCLESLGDVSSWEGSHHDVSWSTVFFVYSLKQQERLGIHKALQFMGDIFLRENEEATAISLFTLALQGFTQMDVHCSRAECMIRLGDISKKNGDVLKALKLWEMARSLFEQSSQTKRIQNIHERLVSVDDSAKQQHQQNLTHLAELSLLSGQVDEDDSDMELELDEVAIE